MLGRTQTVSYAIGCIHPVVMEEKQELGKGSTNDIFKWWRK
jgi:hypothetical protein